MFREFLRLLFSLVRSPLLLGVALLGVIVNLAILALMSGAVFTIIADLVYGPALAGDWTSLIAWSGIYAVELMIITLGLFAVLVVNAGVGLAFGRFAALQQERKTQVLGATGYALGKTGLLVAWGVFMGMLALAGVVVRHTRELVFFTFSVGQYTGFGVVAAVGPRGISNASPSTNLRNMVTETQEVLRGFAQTSARVSRAD
jgi:hypothetical protein